MTVVAVYSGAVAIATGDEEVSSGGEKVILRKGKLSFGLGIKELRRRVVEIRGAKIVVNRI